jgi:DNA replication protein DnaD
MSGQGFIYLERAIRDHWLWEIKPFSKGQAWIDLILLANHQDNKTPFDGKLITVKRGSFITSIRKLADKWGWKRDKVAEFLDLLEQDGMIQRDSNHRRTVITIKNYRIYQQKSKPGRKKSDSLGATEGATLGATEGASHGAQTMNEEVMRMNDKRISPPDDDYDPLAGLRRDRDDL